jgi:peptidoglycan/xylan/chitin deacetylase (PgdA/CDA1 family)
MEGIYEYGSRVGVWRILREFERRGLATDGVRRRHGAAARTRADAAFSELGHEIACHGWRWIHYQNVDEATEREHMRLGMEAIEKLTGERPLGWYTGRDSPQHAPAGGRLRRLRVRQRLLRRRPAVLDEGAEERRQRGAAPGRALHAGLQRHALLAAAGLLAGRGLLLYLRDSFDALYAEGDEAPTMMSIGMHCRLLGRPVRIGRAATLPGPRAKYMTTWGVCRRIDIGAPLEAVHPTLTKLYATLEHSTPRPRGEAPPC